MVSSHAEVISGADCPCRILLEQIADKWSVLVLCALHDGPQRFNSIKRRLQGITQKALTQTLRRLERNGIVARQVLVTSPVAVEYRITPLGRTLQELFRTINAWTVENLPNVERAQIAFDHRKAA